MEEICCQCKERTGTVLLGSEIDKSELFCGLCAVSQIVCDAMRKQGMDENQAAEEWNLLRKNLDQAYLEMGPIKAN
jgi:hypothetical protein